MKKTALLAGLLLSMLMPAAFSAAEAEAVTEAAEEPAAVVETIMDPIYGIWYKMGSMGEYINLDTKLFIYPDLTAVIDDQKFQIETKEDGTFSFDLSRTPGAEGITITGAISPISDQSLTDYGVERDKFDWLDYSAKSQQLILTITTPDQSNPLAPSVKTTTVYYLKMTTQEDFIRSILRGKIWTIGTNKLAIDADGNLSLNSGASTGTSSCKSSLGEGISMIGRFNWDGGGGFDYIPTKIDADTIELQNMDNPSEVLTLKLDSVLEAAPEAMTE